MKINSESGFGLVEILLIVTTVALLALVGWIAFSNLNKNETQDATSNSSTQQTERPKNIVLNEPAGSPDLVAFLKADYTGCENMNERGTYKIIKEVPGFAELRSGCGEVDAFIIAKMVNDKWALISPTNQFTPSGIPSCKMVDEHKIPKQLEPQCAVEPLAEQTNPKNLRAVTY